MPRERRLPTPEGTRGEYLAQVFDLPLFSEQRLPPRYREYHFEVDCGMCLPSYLIRIRRHPDGHASGDAHLLWFAPDPDLIDDTTARARTINNPPNNCASPLRKPRRRGPGFDYTWCRARLSKDLNWSRLLRSLDSLGVLDLPTASGYAPDPPTVRVDTFKLQDRTVHAPRWDCNDIGGTSLDISMLVGNEYRAAYFWCLERKPPGTEHSRVAKAYELLYAAVERYRF